MTQHITVDPTAARERLDLFLATTTGQTRSQLKRLIETGAVQVNRRPATPRYLVKPGDAITLELPAEPATRRPAAPQLRVIYQDDDLVIIDKPAGLVVHPGAGTAPGQSTVADFARTVSSDPDAERPGIVHRLDRDTSGLLIIARTAEAKHFLHQALAKRQIHKTYTALVTGRIEPAAATIDLPLGRDARRPLQQAVVPGGRPAQTVYRTIATYPGYTLVEAQPLTGRTHQLRVHFAAAGHPIVGDATYGQPAPTGLRRQFLHATRLEFTGPHGQPIRAVSPLAPDLQDYLSRLTNLV
ncbi:MAG TPA: RluA family pseudouridine synthase [Candidatus Saccharimonadia bacterium]